MQAKIFLSHIFPISYRAFKKRCILLSSKIIKGKRVCTVLLCLYEVKEQAKTKSESDCWGGMASQLERSLSKPLGLREMFCILDIQQLSKLVYPNT